ncbi:MAG: class II aldolase/adducin family protein [Candidatus Aminicenantes bacterium]|nr:class II aldolase/adducin family protein [Candidatus Aminicenantes bacterium]
MIGKDWQASEELLRLFRTIGRASLLLDLQDSHSGNMAVKWTDRSGREKIVITATGSQKGDLEASQICFLSPGETDYGYYKASSETDIHARILAIDGVRATFHAHTKDLVVATFDDADKPNKPPAFIPVDPLGWHHLGGVVPVDWLAVPSGSFEVIETVPKRLADHPATVVQTHGTFARGRTLQEAFFLLGIANTSGYIVRLLQKLGIDVDKLRAEIQTDPAAHFQYRPVPYEIGGDDVCDFPEEEEILAEFRKTGNRVFESRLSPFHTGSISARGVDHLLYAGKGAMPRDLGGPLRRLPIRQEAGDLNEILIHKLIYAETDFQTVMHCYLPEAEALAYFRYPGETGPADRVIPIDAEGGFLYLVIPVLPPKVDDETLIRKLHEYKVVIVRGGGVWAVGAQSLSEVLHHPSSVREICLYRIGALERGLDLRKMEPKKAQRW